LGEAVEAIAAQQDDAEDEPFSSFWSRSCWSGQQEVVICCWWHREGAAGGQRRPGDSPQDSSQTNLVMLPWASQAGLLLRQDNFL